MQNSSNILSLIERKSRVRLQEYKFLVIIWSLRSGKIVLSIKTWQEFDSFELSSIFFLWKWMIGVCPIQYSTTSRFWSGKKAKTTQRLNRQNHRKLSKKTQPWLAKVLPPNRLLQILRKLHLRCLEKGMKNKTTKVFIGYTKQNLKMLSVCQMKKKTTKFFIWQNLKMLGIPQIKKKMTKVFIWFTKKNFKMLTIPHMNKKTTKVFIWCTN